MTVLRIDTVSKRFGPRDVLNGVSFTIAAGERVALLGHNGAGKTTLIRAILGLTGIDAGRIEVDGCCPGSAAARRMTAYLPETAAFHRLLTGAEQLRALARIKGEPASVADDLLERVGLAGDGNRRIGTYSKGMRQRLSLAQALIGRPRLVLLDEPTSGLDPVARWDFYRIVDALAKEGAAVVLSSHALTEIEAKTDRLVMLRQGRLVADGNLDCLRRRAALPTRLRIAARAESLEEVSGRLGGGRINCRSLEIDCAPDQKLARLAEVVALGDRVLDVDIQAPGLDDLYRHFSSGEE